MKSSLLSFCLVLFLCSATGVCRENLCSLPWKFRSGTVRSGECLQFRSPEDPAMTRNLAGAYARLETERYQGHEIEITLKFRAKNLFTSNRYGAKGILEFKGGNGVRYLFAERFPNGTYEWKTVRLFAVIPKGSRESLLKFGLYGCSGKLEVDLAGSSVRIADELPEKQTAPSPSLENECRLLEKRIADTVKKRKVDVSRVEALLNEQNADGSFRSVDYGDDNRSRWKTSVHLTNAELLARCWSDEKNQYFHQKEVGTAAVKAVRWWCENRPVSSNWWWNDMWVPRSILNLCFLAPELFKEKNIRDAMLQVCRQSRFLDRYTGHNQVFIARNRFLRGVIERDEKLLDRSAEILKQEIRIVSAPKQKRWEYAGIRTDGSFQQHGPQLQFGNYGGQFLEDMAYWANLWKGTRWQLSAGHWNVIRHLAGAYGWILWNGRMDLLACGRQVGRGASVSKGKWVLASLRRLRAADPEGEDFYDEFLKKPFSGNRFFQNSDLMIHRRPTWYASLRMNSVRVRPVEDDVNGDNALGRYFSDAVCLVQRDGLEYEDLTAAWDWSALPGTTLPAMPVVSGKKRRFGFPVSGQVRELGETAFVGGISDGVHGVTVFTMNLDGVQAKKSCFFDENAIFHLGAGIRSSSPYEVVTTVNSPLARGRILAEKDRVWHDGIGYCGKNLEFFREKRTGDWRILDGGIASPQMVTKELFRIRIRHGLKPENASYSFAVLPCATPEQTFIWNWESRILANTETLQAVRLKDGTIGAVFHAPGKLGSFETKNPGVFLIRGTNVSAADPTQTLSELTFGMKKHLRTIPLPRGNMAGTSVSVSFPNE